MAAPVDPALQTWLFLACAIAFAIKVPMWPFHTWLPDAHVEAPTAGSVILAGVLLKMGTYGFMKLGFPLFPAATAQLTPLIQVLVSISASRSTPVSMPSPRRRYTTSSVATLPEAPTA